MNSPSNLPAICNAVLESGELGSRCVVSTRPGGGVDLTVPSQRCMAFLGQGGWLEDVSIRCQWQGSLRELGEYLLATQPRWWAAKGVEPMVALRFTARLLVGGAGEDEVWSLLIAKDVPKDNDGIEIWPVEAVPQDRFYRDAWRRDREGGPIYVDLEAARLVQQRKAVIAAREHNATQERLPELWGHNGPELIELDYFWVKRRCETAKDLEELRAVWPAGLPLPGVS